MSTLYIDEILTPKQKVVFDNLKLLKKVGVLAGGTALAFQLKHRRLYDFDIFTSNKIPGNLSWEARKIFGRETKIFHESENELTFLLPQDLKSSFFIIHLGLFIKQLKPLPFQFSIGGILQLIRPTLLADAQFGGAMLICFL